METIYECEKTVQVSVPAEAARFDNRSSFANVRGFLVARYDEADDLLVVERGWGADEWGEEYVARHIALPAGPALSVERTRGRNAAVRTSVLAGDAWLGAFAIECAKIGRQLGLKEQSDKVLAPGEQAAAANDALAAVAGAQS